MSQRRSQRGGAAAGEGGRSQGPTSADGEVRIGLNGLILGNGPGARQYGWVFSQAAPLRFYTQYAEYERAMELGNNAVYLAPCSVGCSAAASVHPFVPVADLLILMRLNYRKAITRGACEARRMLDR